MRKRHLFTLVTARNGIVHRIWRCFPRRVRQKMYTFFTEIGVPSVPNCDERILTPPIVVVGALQAPTGLGQAARLALLALSRAGIDCRAVDITQHLLQPCSEPTTDFRPPGPGPGTLLVYVTPPNAARAIRAVPRAIRNGKLLVAGWVCETTHLPDIWLRQSRFFHVLSAPSQFSADALSATTGRRVRVCGHPVDAEATRPLGVRVLQKTIVIGGVIDVGSSAARKNIHGLLETMEILLSRSVCIRVMLKLRDLPSNSDATESARRLVESSPERVVLVEADDSREDTLRFLGGLDLLLSLSRAEGFALPYVEAISRGILVAAPRWGGPMEYLNDDNSIALPFDLVPITDLSALYGRDMGLWADVDPRQAADAVMAALGKRGLGQSRPEVPVIGRSDFFVRSLLGSE